MRGLLITFISNWLCFLGVGYFFPSWVFVDGWKPALIGGIILGLINMILKPILTIITLPLHIITFGIFSIVINAFLLYLTSHFITGISIPSFWPYALYAAIAFGILNWILMLVLKGKR